MAGLCTGPGPCDPKVLGTGKNWVTKAGKGTISGGLPLYIRAIANALKRSGHSETDAITLAIGTVRRWAAGQGKVTPATRARAAKALAQWEALRARAHDHAVPARPAIDLALAPVTSVGDGPKVINNDLRKRSSKGAAMRPQNVDQLSRPQLIQLAKKAETMPEPARSRLKAKIRKRALALGMKPDGDGDFDYDVPAKAGASLSRTDLAVSAAQRRQAKVTYPGSDKFPISSQAQFEKAWRLRGNSTIPKAKVEAWLRGVAKRCGYTIPSGAS